MRALIQRVTQAQVTVAGEIVGAIGEGLCVLVGVTHTDTEAHARKLADKLWNVRLMDDDSGTPNRSVADTTKSILVISQFTLYGDASAGRRPTWIAAAKPDHAEPLIQLVVDELRSKGATVETGRFRTDMQVTLTNNGPITLMLEV